MIKNWLTWINWSIAGLAGLIFAISFYFYFQSPEITVSDPFGSKRALPTIPFKQPQDAYQAIGKNCFELQFTPIALQLPDLRNYLTYCGKNGRPDAQKDNHALHFLFLHNAAPTSILANEKTYLEYDKTKTPSQYIFSPGNQETSLWIEPSSQGNEAIVNVFMKNEEGEIIREPSSSATFRLPEKDMMKGNKTWELGKWRVDGSLLARQRARWMGQDQFLERHGGDEFGHLKNKHRIDFTTEEDEVYSIFVGLNDNLIWTDDQWKMVKPGDDTLSAPLMVVKKVEERIMSFELWDVGGKNKIVLNLIKNHEAWLPQDIQKTFKFLGARTRSQYIFELDKQRIFISPKDWLLQTEDGWVKLASAQQIDDYVDGRLKGILFVFGGLEKNESGQMLKGIMYNHSRTDSQEIEIPIQQVGKRTQISDKKEKEEENEEDDIDVDDDDDEEKDFSTPNHLQAPPLKRPPFMKQP